MAAANFDRCLGAVLRHEGGYVDDPRDNGGATNKGVTLATLKEAKVDLDGDGDTDKADLKRLTDKDAGKIYKARYWNTVHGDELPSGLDYMLFDASVNHGPARARRWLQQALGVSVDGVLGPKTFAALRAASAAALLAKIAGYREALYRNHEDFDRFGRGWMRRLTDVSRVASQMLA
ncbi:glycoside hydrolase family 108 protein [Phenylobacterium deserti]|uniref:Uncharacterized protein n=1 Tax=Phenylobacterium deserti TaxID=1914756 RepID=A0A328ACD2_9CAUL|nr:glycosyl hydrolase 108 family protein [Phenylobacterium deserti]RAK52147.1 hypothetical protein DJ018_13405 [Phenylobacterium deserti]